MTPIAIHSQDRTSQAAVDFDTLEDKGYGASPTNLAGHSNCWRNDMQGPDGTRYAVTFAFSDDEAELAADGDAGRLPWDADHVARITLRDE